MSFLVRPPKLLRSLYSQALWRMDKTQKNIYLTFDDGPIEELTPWVLDLLAHYNIKATFFCVGENILKHPQIFDRVLSEGHQVGNHSFNHLKGWNSNTIDYIKNVGQCEKLTKTGLFRPPYGRIKKSQFKILRQHYQLVFWDVLSYDYDSWTTPETCLRNCLKNTRNGSIVVFHDNIKAKENLTYALPHYIEYFLKLNYKFVTL